MDKRIDSTQQLFTDFVSKNGVWLAVNINNEAFIFTQDRRFFNTLLDYETNKVHTTPIDQLAGNCVKVYSPFGLSREEITPATQLSPVLTNALFCTAPDERMAIGKRNFNINDTLIIATKPEIIKEYLPLIVSKHARQFGLNLKENGYGDHSFIAPLEVKLSVENKKLPTLIFNTRPSLNMFKLLIEDEIDNSLNGLIK